MQCSSPRPWPPAASTRRPPPAARGQVFIWVGVLKIAAGSAGTATAGAFIGGAAWLPIVAVATLTAVAAAIGGIGRARNRI